MLQGLANTPITWKSMLYDSELVIKGEVIKSGNFHCRVKALEIYHGDLNQKELKICGFSDKNVKMNFMNEGDEYIYFLKEIDGCYHVWSPMSGFLKVDKSNVQYDLLHSSVFATQNYNSLKEFEEFLYAVYQEKDHSKYYEGLLKNIEKNIFNDISAQYIMMLKLVGYNEYHPILLESIFNENINTRIAVARYLGGLDGQKARENLVTLLNNKDDIVASEAASQLVNFDPQLAGDALKRKLERQLRIHSPEKGDKRPINAFTLKLISLLAEIKYKPAIPIVTPLLYTSNAYSFKHILGAVNKLGATGHGIYLNFHLVSKDSSLYDTILSHLSVVKVDSGEQIIMPFIDAADIMNPTYSYLMSTLKQYRNSEVDHYVINKFTNWCMDSTSNQAWVEACTDYLIGHQIISVKNEFYKCAEEKLGMNSAYISSDSIYETSDSLELRVKDHYIFSHFVEYLSVTGDINDVIYLHKLESIYSMSEANKNELRQAIENLDAKLSDSH